MADDAPKKSKWKLVVASIILVIGAISYGLFQMEFVQKKFYDKIADVAGADRTVIHYSKMTGKVLWEGSDKDTRLSFNEAGAPSFWFGTKNQKVTLSPVADWRMIDNIKGAN